MEKRHEPINGNRSELAAGRAAIGTRYEQAGAGTLKGAVDLLEAMVASDKLLALDADVARASYLGAIIGSLEATVDRWPPHATQWVRQMTLALRVMGREQTKVSALLKRGPK